MKPRFSARGLTAALALTACIAGSAFAQDASTTARPMFERLKPVVRNDVKTPTTTPLRTWNSSFVYKNKTYKYNMVGTAPSTGVSTTIKAFIIPVVFQIKNGTTTSTFSPLTKQSNGLTAVQNTTASPVFKSMDFTSNGVDMGTTQYIDAFQRGNFWGTVQSKTGYHVLLSSAPTQLPTLTLSVPSADGKVANDFGITVGNVDIFWFDTQIQNYMSSHTQITPNTLPIFITYNSYLTEFGSCCIGGYHSSFGSSTALQSYAHFTYISTPGIFSQDVSALSHEVGEWLDDPLVVNTNGNTVACGILEVGDPEESFANYGGFPYTLNGFTYNLQDLTFLPYFGAPTSTSVGNSLTFQGNPFNLGVCSNGG
jgi:hypothetical protein